jgi:hypothetical protein
MEGSFQNNLKELPGLKNTRYENIFKLYQTKNSQYYYNLIQSIFLPDSINEEYLYYQQVTNKMPWTTVSYNAYKTIDLWWLICLTNKIYNPLDFPIQGTLLKIIKPDYVGSVLNEIRIALK